MNEKLENKLNTLAYYLIIFAEFIYIYVTNNKSKLKKDDADNLVLLARTLLFIVAIYFLINAFIGLKSNKNSSQYKQVIAAILALIASFTRLTIKSDDIEFR